MSHPTELELHQVQTEILHRLLFVPTAAFHELVPAAMTSDHFTFHLKKMVEHGLVAKNEDGLYALTITGKEFANRYDTDHKVMERQGKVAVLLLITRDLEGEVQYLIQKRVKQPYYGFYGRPTGKIKWGETILEGAARELMEETGLVASLSVVGIEHKVDRDPEGKLLEDKYFFLVRGVECEGDLLPVFEGGENYWMTSEEIAALTETFGNLLTGFPNDGVKITLHETQYVAKGY